MKSLMKAVAAIGLLLLMLLSLAACSPNTKPAVADPATATLLADFSEGIAEAIATEYPWEYEGPLSVEVLANGLSVTSGLDFFVKGEISGNKASVSWMDSSTLVAGLDDREQKEDFFFYDAISLNWFMMDSLAITIKKNFPEVTEVYYSGENGEPVVFPNPEDMAGQGLPVLPVDLPYEGSSFFLAHADGRGDPPEVDGESEEFGVEDQAEYFMMQHTKSQELAIKANGGKPAYIYKGEGELEGLKAWFFDLGTNSEDKFTAQHHFAINEESEVFEMDIFGDWQLISGELPSWNGFYFGPNLGYREDYSPESDSGDALPPYEAAKLVFEIAKENGNIPGEYSDETDYTIVLTSIEKIGDAGEECYVYVLEVDEPTSTIGAAYAYAYQSGNIYMQGYGGQWVPLVAGG